MIFATCGSSTTGFARMMDALSSLSPTELCVQHGPASPPPGCREAYDYLAYDEMVEMIERADHFVSHAGVGSIICGIKAGHVPVVFPRLRAHGGEAVDDHQAELAEALASRGVVTVAWDATDLVEAIATTPSRGAPRTLRAEELGAAVGAALRGECKRRTRWGQIIAGRQRQRGGSPS